MKFLKKLGILLLILFGLFCGLAVWCAFEPDVTDTIAGFLYPDKNQPVMSGADDGPKENGPDNQPSPGGINVTDLGANNEQESMDALSGNVSDIPGTEPFGTEEGLAEDISTEYIPPGQTEVSVPEKVSGKSGYQRIQEEKEQIGDEEARALKEQIGTGNTGDGLTFDPVYYPYYAMLDEKGKHLYRQIYANANDLNPVFAPVEEISASQLKNVFAAVYNDHPELFWMETAYSCKYRRDGQCVEIDLRFNRTARNLEEAKAAFNENANAVLNQAGALGSSYEKEKLVHDILIDKISYNTGAEMNQSAYSALVNGQTVCAGYARAYQYLLQQLGIPCYYCTGYAGENHAWNIVALEDGYYNVDATWDDTDGGNYDYFNKTDQDYSDTHIRQELSVHLPPCNGQMYRNLEQPESGGEGQAGEQAAGLSDDLRTIEEIGIAEEEVLHSLADYYEDCYGRLTAMGQGNYEFVNVIEGEQLMQELYGIYQTDAYRQGFMDSAMTEITAVSCEMSLKIEELAGDRYLITHSVNMR